MNKIEKIHYRSDISEENKKRCWAKIMGILRINDYQLLKKEYEFIENILTGANLEYWKSIII